MASPKLFIFLVFDNKIVIAPKIYSGVEYKATHTESQCTTKNSLAAKR